MQKTKTFSLNNSQAVMQSKSKHNIRGDWNVKIRVVHNGEERTEGRHGAMCERNNNGDSFVDICGINNIPITTTMFPHKEIDHVAINSKFKRLMQVNIHI
jgi:hypothetical protein